jgi:hypothetical protein
MRCAVGFGNVVFTATRLASYEVDFLLDEPLDLIDNSEQHLHCGVGRLRVAPADADLAWSCGINREFDPRDPATRVHGVGPTANDQRRIEALHLFPKRVQRGCLGLGLRAQYPNGGCYHILVSEVFGFKGN